MLNEDIRLLDWRNRSLKKVKTFFIKKNMSVALPAVFRGAIEKIYLTVFEVNFCCGIE